MKVLVLGGAGFLGANMAASMMANGHAVHLLDRQFDVVSSTRILGDAMGVHLQDARDTGQIVSLVERHKIDCVINLVSTLLPSSPFEAFAQEMLHVTLPGFRLLNELSERSVKYVYFSSGGTVYGTHKAGKKSESDLTLPINHYGFAKLLYEEYISLLSRTHGLNSLIIRPSNPYGPFQDPTRKQGIIAVALDRIRRGEEIEIWGDGSVVRDYVWVKDLTFAVTALIEVSAWGQTYNVGAGVGHSVNQVISAIELIVGKKARLAYKPARVVDAPDIVLDISKIKSVIEYDPVDLRVGLERYIGNADVR